MSFGGVVFTHPVGYSRLPSAVNDLSVTKYNEFVKAIRLRFSPKLCKQRVHPFDRKPSLAHIVRFRVVLRVDLVLRVVNGVLVAVIVHSICIPNSCIFHIAKTGLLEVLSLQERRIFNE